MLKSNKEFLHMPHDVSPSPSLSAAEKKMLRLLEEGLPLCLRPYEEIARKAGCSEEEVMALIQRLKQEKTIRRFGAGINHRKAGFRENALLAWNLENFPEETAASLGEAAASLKFISHCYLRPSPCPDWPYSLYTMLHASSPCELDERVKKTWKRLQEVTPHPLKKPLVLRTLEEYKKSSMNYF